MFRDFKVYPAFLAGVSRHIRGLNHYVRRHLIKAHIPDFKQAQLIEHANSHQLPKRDCPSKTLLHEKTILKILFFMLWTLMSVNL